MNLWLLTHEKEISKATNTGALVASVLKENSKVIVWERRHPNNELMAVIEQGDVALLYPSEISLKSSDAPDFSHYIILDGTWQQARKMYNKSSYLHNLPTIQIDSNAPSAFNLRRNQKAQGLCTVESVIALFRSKYEQPENLQDSQKNFNKNLERANKLQIAFDEFMLANRK